MFLIKKRRSAYDVQYQIFTSSNWQKQPPEVFCKKNCSKKFRNIHQKTPVLETLFNKFTFLLACNFIRKIIQHRCFPAAKFLRKFILKNASELTLRSYCLERCFWTVAFKTILTCNITKKTSRFQTRALNTIQHIWCRFVWYDHHLWLTFKKQTLVVLGLLVSL